MTTESPLFKSVSPALLDLNRIVTHGWDIKDEPLFNIARDLNIAPVNSLFEAKDELSAIRGRTPPAELSDLGGWIRQEADLITEMQQRHDTRFAVLVNLCPTEPIGLQPILTEDDEPDWRHMSRLTMRTPGVTPSRLYFRLAIEANLHFVNFTPNVAETKVLRGLAAERSLLYCGRDGKTGQTFLKTVLAPALRDRNLRIDGWFSTNLLGNDDGVTLANEDCRKTKQRSKLEALPIILGYQPGGSSDCHQVHIHYYPPRGDAKEAWDNIDFTGFLGARMQLKVNWLGRDSLLAAPAVLDLVRLVCYGASRERTGLLQEMAYFFKDPLVEPGGRPVHSTPDQFRSLLEFVGARAARS